MSEARNQPGFLRRSGAVFAGLLTIFALSMGTDAVLHMTGIYPPMGEIMSDRLLVLSTAYRSVSCSLPIDGRAVDYFFKSSTPHKE